ncbi:hypothetical protein LUQ84_000584 [Hamiltosporidium tvaerminnensis]|nr:hypothetical protein LUQ84_000584 [Hamiltosporidium tvaerminnensis]
MYDKTSQNEILEIFELQGEVENIELINCHFNRDKIQLVFDNFTLNGYLDSSKCFTVVKRTKSETGVEHKSVGVCRNVYVFSQPPKFKIEN